MTSLFFFEIIPFRRTATDRICERDQAKNREFGVVTVTCSFVDKSEVDCVLCSPLTAAWTSDGTRREINLSVAGSLITHTRLIYDSLRCSVCCVFVHLGYTPIDSMRS